MDALKVLIRHLDRVSMPVTSRSQEDLGKTSILFIGGMKSPSMLAASITRRSRLAKPGYSENNLGRDARAAQWRLSTSRFLMPSTRSFNVIKATRVFR